MHVPACVLAVLDVKGGQIVQAIAGRRSAYRPLISKWSVHAADPYLLTTQLKVRLGLTEFYLADLDALEQQGNHGQLICNLAAQGYRIWLDAGIRSVQQAERLSDYGIHRLIIASESLPSLDLLTQLLPRVDAARLAFSLDLHEGKIRCQPGVLEHLSLLQIVDTVTQLGITQLIVLDSSVVGTAQGPVAMALCRQIKTRFPACTLISGGGVRGLNDIEQLQCAGVDRVLVSTWLHSFPTTTAPSSSGKPGR